MNSVVELEGKYTSDSFKLLRLSIQKCRNETDPSRPCVDESVINELGYFYLKYYFMNAFVNSASLQPVDYYLEDRNYFGFDTKSTV